MSPPPATAQALHGARNKQSHTYAITRADSGMPAVLDDKQSAVAQTFVADFKSRGFLDNVTIEVIMGRT